jgi:hypothetical protein
MVKRSIAALAATLVLALAPLSAHATNPQAPNSVDAAGLSETQPMPSLDWTGCIPFRVEQTTVPVLVVTGSGELFELNETSGTVAAAYTIAYDTGVITCSGGAANTAGCATQALGVNGVANLPKGYAITPRVFTDTGGAIAAPTVSGQGRSALRPRRFAVGLAVANSDAGANTSGCYRTDAMNAANPVTQ